MHNRFQRWTPEDDARALQWVEKGWGYAEIAKPLGRTAAAVKTRLRNKGALVRSHGGRLTRAQIAVALGVDPKVICDVWPKHGLRVHRPKGNQSSAHVFVEPQELRRFLEAHPEAAPPSGRSPRLIRERLGFWQGLPAPAQPARYKRLRCSCDWEFTAELYDMQPRCPSCKAFVCYIASASSKMRYTDEASPEPLGTPWERIVWEGVEGGAWARTHDIARAHADKKGLRRHPAQWAARNAARSLAKRRLCELSQRGKYLWVRRRPGAQPVEAR